MCTAGERHAAAAAAACCCLFCVTPGFPLPCTVYFELTLGMGLISILRMAAQIEETRNVPMDVLKTYSKASLHALLEQFELYFPQSAKHDMLVLRLKQAVEAGKNRPRLVPPEMPAGYGYSRLQEQAVDGTNVDIAHPEDKAQDVANMGVHDHVGQQKQSPVQDQHGTGLPESPVRLEHT